jgi:diguanylate cyclase (GGDEF)-like protein
MWVSMLLSHNAILTAFSRLERLPRWLQVSLAVAILSVVFLTDRNLDPYISVSFFYVLPVLITTSSMGGWCGFCMGVVAAVLERYILAVPDMPTLYRVWNTIIRTGTFGLIVAMAATLRTAIKNERLLARQDYLTGLLNRRAFEERAAIELERSRRSRSPMALLYIDCDDFKCINDTSGHHVGDKVLQAIAHALNASMRATDTVARMGGDEFAVLLPDTSEPQARAATANLHDRLGRCLTGAGIECSCSIGVAVFVAPPESVQELLEKADALMYAVKKGGKGSAQVEVYLGGR